MPRGRPPGSKATVDRWDDGRFTVTIYYRADRHAYRIVSGWRGAVPAETSATREDEARAVADAIWRGYQRGDLIAPEPEPQTLKALSDKIAVRTDLRPKTLRSYLQVWSLFGRHVGLTRHPRRVYRMDVVDFLDTVEAGTYSPRSEPDSPNTLVTYHRTLRAGFNWAITKRWLDENPTDEIELEGDHHLGPYLPYDEWEPFLTQCSPAHEIRCTAVLEGGLRASEIAFARPEWLRGQVGRRAIYIGPDEVTGWRPKGMSRIVPLTDRFEEAIAKARAMWPGSRWLFSHEGLSALGNLSRETRDAVRLAGCTRTTFHGLRRSAGAHWLDCGLSLYEVSLLLGHRDISTTQRWYADLSDSALVAAIARVERARIDLAGRDDVPELGAQLYGLRRR
jgi:integrase